MGIIRQPLTGHTFLTSSPWKNQLGFFPMVESSKSHTSRADKELESISNLYNLSGIFHLAMMELMES